MGCPDWGKFMSRSWEAGDPGERFVVFDEQGEAVGDVVAIFGSKYAEPPEWAVVATSRARYRFVPLIELMQFDPANHALQIPYPQDIVEFAPDAEPTSQLTVAQVEELVRHYGLEPSFESLSGAGEAFRRMETKRLLAFKPPGPNNVPLPPDDDDDDDEEASKHAWWTEP